MQILATKLYMPPPRPELVARPRLLTRLNEGLLRKLTLVSAPAGFGKTTIVSDWLQQIDLSCAWLSLDEGDNDLIRFLTYLTVAFERVDPQIGQSTQLLLQSPQSLSAESLITALINDITVVIGQSPTAAGQFILVLDDYHVIENSEVDQALTFLVDHLPPQVHLVILSRVDPSLPLSRLRARGQLTELRTDDLRFTLSETATFLSQMTGLDLTATDVAALENRTEGWIAGLQLAALSINKTTDVEGFITDFTGSHRYIIDYLTDEVLDQQPEEIRNFLLETSILRRLCGPLCDKVTARSVGDGVASDGASSARESHLSRSSQVVLEHLEHANLFIIPLDDKRRWYRYHHLFADLLQQRLHQTRRHDGHTAELHYRAGQWYEQQAAIHQDGQLVGEALHHALKADNVERAARLVTEYGGEMIMRGEIATVKEWLDSLPPEVIRASPRLCLGQAWIYFFTQQLEAIEPFLKWAEQGVKSTETTESGRNLGLLGEIAGLRAWVARNQGDYKRAIQLSQQALEYLPADRRFERGMNTLFLASALDDIGETKRATEVFADSVPLSRAAGNTLAAMGATAYMASLQIILGQLRQATTELQQAIRQAARDNMQALPATAQLYTAFVDVLYEQNDLAQAEIYLNKSLELIKPGLISLPIFGITYLSLARLKQAQGEANAAKSALDRVEHAGRAWSPNQFVTDLIARRVQLLLAQGNLAAALVWQQELGLRPDEDPTYRRELGLIMLARILMAQAQTNPANPSLLSEAVRLLKRLSQSAATAGRMGRVIEILALQAVAQALLGKVDEGTAALEQALALAEPEGYVRIFIDEGAVMAALLKKLAERGAASGYVRKLLAAFPDFEPSGEEVSTVFMPERDPSAASDGAGYKVDVADLVEPLTERELEVLRLVAAGMSNRDVAEELVLAVSTVKRHMSNIYGKLGINSRTQAVARARELNLL